MSRSDFHLVSDWDLAAPPARVWEALMRPAEWPIWWPAVTRAEVIERGDPDGVGSYIRFEWRTALPFRLAFDIRTTRVEPPTLIEGRAAGVLTGTGRWRLTPTPAGTHVRYDWIVTLEAPGLRLFAPLARKAFVWNHDQVMRSGRDGLARKLGVF